MNALIQPGRILAGRYRIDQQIGVGGMAVVYRATDLNTQHFVAVKVLKPEYNQDAEYVARFQREAEAASKMTHHNIVNLLDVGMDSSGNRYLIMEYVEGQTLKDVIREKGRLSETSAVQITIRILSALQHAHSNGIIHRDIKPQNILMQSDGHVKVADFGIARMANKNTLAKGDSVMGSVHYFSPEQASGKEAGVTSDIYSVGVTLYEMLTGRVPFDSNNPVAIAMQHIHNTPVPIQQYAPETSDAVCHVCMKAMDKIRRTAISPRGIWRGIFATPSAGKWGRWSRASLTADFRGTARAAECSLYAASPADAWCVKAPRQLVGDYTADVTGCLLRAVRRHEGDLRARGQQRSGRRVPWHGCLSGAAADSARRTAPGNHGNQSPDHQGG